MVDATTFGFFVSCEGSIAGNSLISFAELYAPPSEFCQFQAIWPQFRWWRKRAFALGTKIRNQWETNMIPNECVSSIYETIRVVAWRMARRYGLEPDDLAQDSYLTLSQIPIDEKKSKGRSLELAYRAMIHSVVEFTARKLYRREKNHRHSSFLDDAYANVEADQTASIEEDIFDSGRIPNGGRALWQDQARASREDGLDAWRAGHAERAERRAEDAAMYSVIGNMPPERWEIPVLSYVYGRSAAEIAAKREITSDNVSQINSRFKQVVRQQREQELNWIRNRDNSRLSEVE